MKQADFFATDSQPGLFAEEQATQTYVANPDKVRFRLNAILAEARVASSLPWDAQRLRLYRTIVPQMSLWLPDEEAAQLRLEFDTEVARLESRDAA